MNFDERQARRKIILDRIMFAAQIVGVVYLAAHALVAWKAFEIDGVVAALFTLALLGFGDLYWGLRWAWEGGATWHATVALAVAALCFTSWATRRIFNRWVNQFTIDMRKDFGGELGRMKDGSDPENTETPDEGDDDWPPPDSGKS